MPAWKATKKWDDGYFGGYRAFVSTAALTKRGAGPEDCADLSMSLLIDYAYSEGLPVTFKTGDGWVYSSQQDESLRVQTRDPSPTDLGSWRKIKGDLNPFGGRESWNNKDEFTHAVWKHMAVVDLWYNNNTFIDEGRIRPSPGDMIMSEDHCALVYRAYPPGQPHLFEKDKTIPDYPGDGQARKETNVTMYFRGTTFSDDIGDTLSRRPDADWHFDYLNSRADVKRHAELILFANFKEFTQRDRFEFRRFTSDVLR